MAGGDTFQSSLAELQIENVYIYVADAVRWDHLPSPVADTGIVMKTIAASIHSPPSFASLITGRHVPSHGVTGFDTGLSSSQTTLFDLERYEPVFVNTIGNAGVDDPLCDVLNLSDEQRASTVSELTEPFIIVERGQGGHAPYGEFDGSAIEYFEERKHTDVETLSKEYSAGVDSDGNDFLDRLRMLKAEGLIDRTLVVYTSDHGELLGEGGQFGHGGPIRPELVYVPTVLVHPELTGEPPSELFTHVDLVPTVVDLLDCSVSWRFDGTSVRKPRRSVGFSFYQNEHDVPSLPVTATSVYESVWGEDGGHVFTTSPVYARMISFLGEVLLGPQRWFARKRLKELFNTYLHADRTFGTPPVTRVESRTLIEELKEESVTEAGVTLDISSDAQRRLRALGYRE